MHGDIELRPVRLPDRQTTGRSNHCQGLPYEGGGPITERTRQPSKGSPYEIENAGFPKGEPAFLCVIRKRVSHSTNKDD